MNSTVDLTVALKLMRSCVAHEMPVKEFCPWYEKFWNFELDRADLSDSDSQALEELFNEVVWFVTGPRSAWEYPGYRDEAEIRHAVGVALSQFPALAGGFSHTSMTSALGPKRTSR